MPRSPIDQANPRLIGLKPLNKISETKELTESLKMRLRLGGWTAAHVRLQGNRALEQTLREMSPNSGRQRKGLGVIEAIPASMSWGWLDWTCLHPLETKPLIIELKSEKGELSYEQVEWLSLWSSSGAEIAVVRPRDVYLATEDALHLRLVEHRQCRRIENCQKSQRLPAGGPHCTGWCRARDEAEKAIARRNAEIRALRLRP